MENLNFKIIDDGKEMECKIIKIIPSIKMNKDYLIYECNNDIYASRYEILDNKIKLLEIESEEEYDYLDSFLEGKYDYE